MHLHHPSLFAALVLVFGTYRVLRFLGWDDWPPILKLRQKVIGEVWTATLTAEEVARVGYAHYSDGPLPDETERPLPGKTPDSEASDVQPGYRRPTLAHLVHCPFCLGWWISLAVFVAWLVEPTWTLYVLAPFALSGAVGLIAKNLDA